VEGEPLSALSFPGETSMPVLFNTFRVIRFNDVHRVRLLRELYGKLAETPADRIEPRRDYRRAVNVSQATLACA
jgi:hypothetical protein